MMSKGLATLMLLVVSASLAGAQTGSLHGRVFDRGPGEELIGANVLLVGTTLGANTDIDGKFTVRGVPSGIYSIRISFVGYVAQVVSDVQIDAVQEF